MSTTKLVDVEVSNTVLLVGGGVAVVLAIAAAWYVKRKAGAVADAAADAAKATGEYLAKDAVNVTSGKNVANVVLNAGLQATGVLGKNNLAKYTGKEENTIGSAIYEVGQWGSDTFGAFW